MEVAHALEVMTANGVLIVGSFMVRELAPLLGGAIALLFARVEIQEHAEVARGIEADEVLA